MKGTKMKGIIFDVDGVLVDVRDSYRKTIIETANYFTGAEFTLADTQRIKDRGGFNNDWDVTYALVEEAGGSIGDKEQIKAKFQELYSTNKQGEKLLVDPALLARLNQKLGIVTGRPRDEAMEVLGKFEIAPYFDTILTLGDLNGNPNRPDPYILNKCKTLIGIGFGFFCGDTVDDMRAGKAAGLVPIGITSSGVSGETLRAAGARSVLASINQLEELLWAL